MWDKLLEYHPYKVPISEVKRIVKELTLDGIENIARDVLNRWEIVKDFPESFKTVIRKAKLMEITLEGEGLRYLVEKLSSDRIFLTGLLRMFEIDKDFDFRVHTGITIEQKKMLDTLHRKVIEVPELNNLRVCKDYYYDPFYFHDFISKKDRKSSPPESPVRVKVNRKTKTIHLDILGECDSYNVPDLSLPKGPLEKPYDYDISLTEITIQIKNLPCILIVFRYFVTKMYYDTQEDRLHLSSCEEYMYLWQYGVIYDHLTRSALSLKFKESTSLEALKAIKTPKDLLELILPEQKREIQMWIKSITQKTGGKL